MCVWVMRVCACVRVLSEHGRARVCLWVLHVRASACVWQNACDNCAPDKRSEFAAATVAVVVSYFCSSLSHPLPDPIPLLLPPPPHIFGSRESLYSLPLVTTMLTPNSSSCSNTLTHTQLLLPYTHTHTPSLSHSHIYCFLTDISISISHLHAFSLPSSLTHSLSHWKFFSSRTKTIQKWVPSCGENLL